MIINKIILKNWLDYAKKIQWSKFPKKVVKKKFNNRYDWFCDGKLNIYENCIENNIQNGYGDKNCIICINETGNVTSYTYNQIKSLVINFSNFLTYKKKQINKNKIRVMIHSSSSVESAVSMLACAKLGIVFCVIFEDLEKIAILKRIKLFKPDIFFFRKQNNSIKNIIPKNTFQIRKIFNFKMKYKNQISYFSSSRDFFVLFTSGSTGEPKGIVHSYGGYFLYCKYTCEKQFGMNSKSTILCASDAGWINGHTYALFGPLSFGATTILLEKPMILINIEVLKNILNFKVSIIYLPVTLIRLMRLMFKNKKINNIYLKTIGSMGEPLAPDVGSWYEKTFTNKNSAIINTYFQTETGGIICSPKSYHTNKLAPHGSVGKKVSQLITINQLSSKNKKEIKILSPWPGMMKKILNNIKFWNKYWDERGNFKLFDLATKNRGSIYIHGRIDDVINIRGHRVGSEEIESVILKIKNIQECAAISIKHELEGYVIYLFVVSKSNKVSKEIETIISTNFGSFAIPKRIYYVEELPKTKSGKILRRVIRNIVSNPNNNVIEDKSTILNKEAINIIKKSVIQYDDKKN
tara:strand:- start:1656 stop:3392 length:1737 start_codon:yes stop_codon:yes gene_type:complete